MVFSGRAWLEGLHVSRVQGLCHFQHKVSHVGRHAHLHQCGFELRGPELHIAEAGFANGFADDGRHFQVGHVALPQEFPRLFAPEIKFQQRLGRRRANILGGNHRHFQVAAQRTAHHSKALDDPDLRQKVFHKVARAKVDGIQAGNAVQFLFQVVQANHRPRLIRLVGANAAENHGILHAGVLNRRHQGIAHPLLVLPHVGDAPGWAES